MEHLNQWSGGRHEVSNCAGGDLKDFLEGREGRGGYTQGVKRFPESLTKLFISEGEISSYLKWISVTRDGLFFFQ